MTWRAEVDEALVALGGEECNATPAAASWG